MSDLRPEARNQIVREVKAAFEDDTTEIHRNVRDELIRNDGENLSWVVKALRISGILDFLGDAGIDSHTAIVRLLMNLLGDGNNSDRNSWNKKLEGQLYNEYTNALTLIDGAKYRKAGVRSHAPVHILTWSAFADGNYLNATARKWPGIISKNFAGDYKLVQWIINRQGETNDTTSYAQYIDHVHDQLERRLDAVDVVLTDLIALHGLSERRLIVAIDHPTESREHKLAELLSDVGLARLSDLGQLVTINYHVHAGAKRFVGKNIQGDQASSVNTCVTNLVTNGSADEVFQYTSHTVRENDDKTLDPGRFFSARQFNTPLAWLTDLDEAAKKTNREQRVSKNTLRRWWLEPGDSKAKFQVTDEKEDDPLIESLGKGYPIAPIQLAPGAHATYTAFALFSNCGSKCGSLLKNESLDEDVHVDYKYQSVASETEISNKVVMNNKRVKERGNRVLLMPDKKRLKQRAELVFNFVWQFVPATALACDHVVSATYRRYVYNNNWFDPCLPVEAILFHPYNWQEESAHLGNTPTRLRGELLSCFGGYSLALSARSFSDKAKLAPFHIGSRFLDAPELKKHKGDDSQQMPYWRLNPLALDEEKFLGSIKGSAVRPVLGFWATIDDLISDTLRLYVAALFVARALHAHLTATMHKDGTPLNDITIDTKKWIEKFVPDDLPELSCRIQELGRSGKLTFEPLYEAMRLRINDKVVERVLTKLKALTHRTLNQYLPNLANEVVYSCSSPLLADSDYISGIVSSCNSLGDYADRFVNTVASKIEHASHSRHWEVYHVIEDKEPWIAK